MAQKIRETTDEELAKLAREGDREAFAGLTLRHYRSSLALAVSILRDRGEAEDEVQNAYWKAYRHVGQFQGESTFSTWMTRIVINQCLMRLRQRRRAGLAVPIDLSAGPERRPVELRDVRRTPEEELGKVEVAALVRREVGRIPPMLRSALVLRDMQELSMQEVAARLGVTVAAAKSRLLRARAELRERMRKHMGGFGLAGGRRGSGCAAIEV